jgi:hypothetical protein
MTFDWANLIATLAIITPILSYFFSLEVDRRIEKKSQLDKKNILSTLETLEEKIDRRWEKIKEAFTQVKDSKGRQNRREDFYGRELFELKSDFEELIGFLKIKHNIQFFPKKRRVASYESWREEATQNKDTLDVDLSEIKVYKEVE